LIHGKPGQVNTDQKDFHGSRAAGTKEEECTGKRLRSDEDDYDRARQDSEEMIGKKMMRKKRAAEMF
jgi:hypothetical protein